MPLDAIVLDVDGTLLTSDHRIADTTRAAIGRARATGVEILLASARGPAGLRPILDGLVPGGPLVTFSGALVCEVTREPRPAVVTLFERRVQRASASRIVAEASRLGLEIGWHAGEQWYAPAVGPGLRREAAITRQRVALLPHSGAVEEPHKLLCIAHRADGLPALRALRARLPSDCHGQYSHRNYLEITARGIDKAKAVRRVCTLLAIDPGAVAAIGDGENDIALLRLVGTGVAMGHATAAVRAAADWVTDTNDHDGVAVAIDRLLTDHCRDHHLAPARPRVAVAPDG